MTEPQYMAMYALFGATGFVCGAFLQQELSIRNLFDAIKRDPYVYHNRQKLYPVLSTFGSDHEDRLWNRSVGLKDKICQLFFKYILPQPLEKVEEGEPAIPNMLDLLKYGLPSADNLMLHKDYIMSQGIETNSATWICEHFCPESLPDESSLYQRYNDVFADICGCVFKQPIWQQLERHVSLKVHKCGSVYAYTGPIYAPNINANHQCWLEYKACGNRTMPVPSHYFKVLIVERSPPAEPKIEAYIIRNEYTELVGKLRDYRVPIEDIVEQTGLQFSKDRHGPKVLSNNGKLQIDFSLASISEPMLIE